MTLMAHRLAQSGHSCLIVDLHGTGDSEGGFAEARLETWLDDLERAVDWLLASGVSDINLLGIRFGACLATRLAAISATDFSRLILWQPVVRGTVFMTQFLRLKMVSDLVDTATQTTTKQLRETAMSGDDIEVAGYKIAPSLLASIDAFNMLEEHHPGTLKTSIFEITPSSSPRHSMDCDKLVTKWSETGAGVDSNLISGDPFWASTETVVVPELVEATLSRIEYGD